MKSLVVAMFAVACVLTGCTKTTAGVVAQTTEPVVVEGLTCQDFNALGDRDRAAVVDEILTDRNVDRAPLLVGLAQVICQAIPQASVEEVVLGFARR